jgi:dTDP-4-dehydrorhamnose reductase
VKRILLTGATGQVGRELKPLLDGLGTVHAPNRQELDLGRPETIVSSVRAFKPTLIVNAAAYTAVDDAESNIEAATRANADAPGILAEECQRTGALLVHYSTDYVFDGSKGSPYCEDDAPNPVNEYGKSKLAGEIAIRHSGAQHLMLRTSWIYSAQPPNFVLTILRLAREREELRVVTDQIGSPTWARALATSTVNILKDESLCRANTGIYHLSAQGHPSRFEFARKIIDLAASRMPDGTRWATLLPITTADYPLPAARPLNCATSKERVRDVFNIEIPAWDIQLAAFIAEHMPAES